MTNEEMTKDELGEMVPSEIEPKGIRATLMTTPEFTRDQLEAYRRRHLCAECGGELVVWPSGDGQYDLRCTLTAHHSKGYRGLPEGPVEHYMRTGEGTILAKNIAEKRLAKKGISSEDISTIQLNNPDTWPMPIYTKILMKVYPVKMGKDGQIDERFGLPNEAAALTLAGFCKANGLNPFAGQAIWYQNSPMATTKGKAVIARRDPLFAGYETRKATKEEYQERGFIWDEDQLWRADVYMKGYLKPITKFGVVTKREWEALATGRRAGFTYLERDPAYMAEKRAIDRAIMQAVNPNIREEPNALLADEMAIEGIWYEIPDAHLVAAQEVKKLVESGSTAATPATGEPKQVSAPETPPIRVPRAWLTTCPVHNILWKSSPNSFDLFHMVPPGVFCNRSKTLTPALTELRDKLVLEKELEVSALNEWCKGKFSGRTWSKLNMVEFVDAIEVLQGLEKGAKLG